MGRPEWAGGGRESRQLTSAQPGAGVDLRPVGKGLWEKLLILVRRSNQRPGLFRHGVNRTSCSSSGFFPPCRISPPRPLQELGDPASVGSVVLQLPGEMHLVCGKGPSPSRSLAPGLCYREPFPVRLLPLPVGLQAAIPTVWCPTRLAHLCSIRFHRNEQGSRLSFMEPALPASASSPPTGPTGTSTRIFRSDFSWRRSRHS